MLLGQFHRRCLLTNYGSSVFCLHETAIFNDPALSLEGTGATIHQTLSAQYGNSVFLEQSPYEWIGKFKYGHTSIMHEEETQCPYTDKN
jgi:hypothetical protein